MKNKFFSCLLLCCFTIGSTAQNSAKDKRNPFDKFEFIDDHPYIYIDGELAKLIRIADHPVETYTKMAFESAPSDWQGDFVRYTHYFMDDLGINRADSIDATYELEGEIITKAFPLIRENRDLATAHYYSIIGENRITRIHNKPPSDELNYLNVRLDGYDVKEKNWLTTAEAIHDLEHLEWQLVNNYAYINLTKFDYQNAIDVIISDLQDGISEVDFAIQLKILMAHFGDGHTRVSLKYVLKDKDHRGGLPFTIVGHDGKYYGVNSKKKTFFDPKYPMIQSVNDQSIETYYNLAKQFIPKTTAEFVHQNSISYLEDLKLLMKMNGAEIAEKVQVTFGNSQQTIEKELPIGRYKDYSLRASHVLFDTIYENQIGYIALNDGMENETDFLLSIKNRMKKMQKTNGLIIDIRGNGGGSRAPLKTFLPYLIKNPVVCNAARIRIDNDSHPIDGYLERRFAYPENSDQLTSAQQACIALFKKSFVPKYQIDDSKFSDYHYMVVTPEAESRFYYDKPVIVLIDSGCFSASDIFAAGMKQGDNVKLLGVTTGGGSGFSKSRLLPNSKIKVRMSRMVSYQPDGNLYDGTGVKPDVECEYTLEDKLGQTDSMLTKALKLLKPKKVIAGGTTKG